jgi:hypothetical protein
VGLSKPLRNSAAVLHILASESSIRLAGFWLNRAEFPGSASLLEAGLSTTPLAATPQELAVFQPPSGPPVPAVTGTALWIAA